MSSIYINEPPTRGKVVLTTSMGPLEIELWPKEAPKAVRNFVQLCLEGYYDQSIFHRLVKGFILQGGDPTGTGHGGDSIYGGPFADEYHSRLKFSHRGLLAMANDIPDHNQAQFFFTLDRTDDLNGKHTIFGKVVGDTIFNLLKIAEGQVDDDERPLYPVRIINTAVLSNPFEDIVPRDLPKQKAPETEQEKRIRQVRERKGVKNKKLLSFGDDAEFEPKIDLPVKKKSKSAHDLVPHDPRLSKKTILEDTPVQVTATQQESAPHPVKLSEPEEPKEPRKGKEATSSVQDQIENVKREIKQLSRGKSDFKYSDSDRHPEKQSLLEKEQSQFLSQAKKLNKVLIGSRRKMKQSEDELLSRLDSFRSKLRQSNPDSSSDKQEIQSKDNKANELEPCSLHSIPNCASCHSIVTNEDDYIADDWMTHALRFEKDLTGKDLLDPKQRRMDNVEELVVIDPRARKPWQSEVKQTREWDRSKSRDLL